MIEGYLLIYSESGDEVHIDLITEEHYNKIVNTFKHGPEMDIEDVAFEDEPVQKWSIQTFCDAPWPYNDVKILGTVSPPQC